MESLKLSDKQSADVQKTSNRVTLDSMLEKIEKTEYYRPNICPEMTIAVVKLKNGFTLVGKSAPADPQNFNEELGIKFAQEDAIRQMWPLEGYLLRETLSK